jgi:hypothetical protein
MIAKIKFGIIFAFISFIATSLSSCYAQDVIYTKQGGVIRGVTLTRDDGDTLKYIITKSDKADFILKSEVKDYEKKSNQDIYTEAYREKRLGKQMENNPIAEVSDSLDLVNHVGNAISAYLASTLSTPAAFTIAFLLSSATMPVIVPVAILIGGVVMTIKFASDFVRELRLAGYDIVALKKKSNKK